MIRRVRSYSLGRFLGMSRIRRYSFRSISSIRNETPMITGIVHQNTIRYIQNHIPTIGSEASENGTSNFYTGDESSNSATRLLRSTDRFLNEEVYPIGSFTPETWLELEDIMGVCVRRYSLDYLDVSFRLFERLLREVKYAREYKLYTPSDWINSDLLNRLINQWRVLFWSDDIPAHTPQMVLDRLLDYASYNMSLVNEKSFYLVAEGVSRNGDPVEAATLAESALAHSLERHAHGHTGCLPSALFVDLVIKAWARSGHPNAHLEADRLRELMRELDIRRTDRTYLYSIMSRAARGSVEGAESAESLLKEMCQEYQSGNTKLIPSRYAFHQCIFGWLKSGSREAVQRSEKLLDTFFQLHLSKNPSEVRSAIPLMNGIMRILAERKDKPSTVKAQQIFDRIEEIGRPRFESHYHLVRAYANIGDAEKAEEIIKAMPERGLKANAAIWTAAISGWAVCKRSDKADRARAILETMKSSTVGAQPNTLTYNVLLDCIASSDLKFAVSVSEQYLNEMEQGAAQGNPLIAPDWVSYSTVIRCYERFGLANRAVAMLNGMISKYLDGNDLVKPDTHCFDHVLGAYANSKEDSDAWKALDMLERMKDMSAEKGAVLDVRPTVHSYAKVLDALANVKRKRDKAARTAEGILQDMREIYEKGDEKVKPNHICYNTVMNAWARTGKPNRAYALLEQMYSDHSKGNEDAKPSVVSFNAILKALAFSKEIGAGEKAEELVRRMHNLHSSGLLVQPPNVVSYTTVILCYGLSRTPGAPLGADKVYERMKELHSAGKLERPSKVTLNTLRKAWETSNEPNKDERVRQLQLEMESMFGQRASPKRKK